MKKIIYLGKEEGAFTCGSFYHYLQSLGVNKIDGHGISPNDGREITIDFVYEKSGLRIDFLYRSKDKNGPVTVLASGEEKDISEFERVILEENKRRL